MQVDGGGHVLIMDLHVTQVERGQGEDYLWHVPVKCNPFGTRDAWLAAARLWQDPAVESRAPVLPHAA